MDYLRMSPEELVRTCLQEGDESAWAEFIRRFHPMIAGVAFRVAQRWGEASPQIIDDLVQETYLKLCVDGVSFLRNFKSAHTNAIYGFVKVFTANLIQDHFKASRSKKRGGGVGTDSIEKAQSGSSEHNFKSGPATLDRTLLIQEIDACLQVVTPGQNATRDRRIFWLYYRVGLAASEIAALPTIDLSTEGVESMLLRLTRQVRDRLVPRTSEPVMLTFPKKGSDETNRSKKE